MDMRKRSPMSSDDSGDSTTTISRLSSFEHESSSPWNKQQRQQHSRKKHGQRTHSNGNPSPICRICWNGPNQAKGTFVAPCECKGTQKYVHINCLHTWQSAVRQRDRMDERAYKCGVCRSKYTVRAPRQSPVLLWKLARVFGAVICLFVLASGMGGSPWPQVASVFLLSVALRSHGMTAFYITLCGVAVTMIRIRGYRIHLQFTGGPEFGVSVVRHGTQVPGLGVGSLLVSSNRLHNSGIFRETVVLITDFDANTGAKGVILNQPFRTLPPTDDEVILSSRFDDEQDPEKMMLLGQELSFDSFDSTVDKVVDPSYYSSYLSYLEESNSLVHFLGGPVGMPGNDIQPVLVVLHPYGNVEGSRPLFNRTQGQKSTARYFVGGRINEIIERIKTVDVSRDSFHPCSGKETDPVDSKVDPAQNVKKTTLSCVDNRLPSRLEKLSNVFVFHGASTWVQGQLEGEIRSGLWGYVKEASVEDIHKISGFAKQLRGHLLETNRVIWM